MTLADASSRFGPVIHAYSDAESSCPEPALSLPKGIPCSWRPPRESESVDRMAGGDVHRTVQPPAPTCRACSAEVDSRHSLADSSGYTASTTGGLSPSQTRYVPGTAVSRCRRKSQTFFEAYSWSSHQAYAGKVKGPQWLSDSQGALSDSQRGENRGGEARGIFGRSNVTRAAWPRRGGRQFYRVASRSPFDRGRTRLGADSRH